MELFLNLIGCDFAIVCFIASVTRKKIMEFFYKFGQFLSHLLQQGIILIFQSENHFLSL